MKFEDPETGNKVVEIVKVFFPQEIFLTGNFHLCFLFFVREIFSPRFFPLREDLSQVNLTKPEKKKTERRAKAHIESQKVDEQVAITLGYNLT